MNGIRPRAPLRRITKPACSAVAETFVDHLERAGQIAPQQRGGVEPQSGKDQAVHDAAVIGFQPLVAAAAEHEPVDLLIENAPHDVLLDSVAAVRIQFGIQIVAGHAGRHFRDEFGGRLDVIVRSDPHLTVQ